MSTGLQILVSMCLLSVFWLFRAELITAPFEWWDTLDDTTPLLWPQWLTLHMFSLLLDSGTIKQRTVCMLQTHYVISPLNQKYWGINLICVWSPDAWCRIFCPVLSYKLCQQRISCWLYGDTVVSAGMSMCGYICWCISMFCQSNMCTCAWWQKKCLQLWMDSPSVTDPPMSHHWVKLT